MLTVVLLVSAVGGVRPVAAQVEDEPERPAGRLFTLDAATTYIEFETEFIQDRVHTKDRNAFNALAPGSLFGSRDSRQTNRDWRLEERLGLRVAGSIIDPRVMTYRGDFSFALTQGHYDEDATFGGRSDSDWGHLLDYDVRVDIMPGQPFSGSVYGLRIDDRVPRRFQPTLHERRTGFGTSWAFVKDDLSIDLRYDHEDVDRTGSRDRRDDEHFTDDTLYFALGWDISEHQRLQTSYEHAVNKQEYQGSRRHFETTRDLWIFDHRLAFGPDHQHDLRTRVRWQRESGDFARDLFEFGPQLTLRHSDAFQTSYKYQFNIDDYRNQRINSHRGEFQFVHQLYTNLTTTGQAFLQWEKINNDTESFQYGGSIDWQYNRNNRYGRFLGNLRVGFDNEDIDGSAGGFGIINEAHTFFFDAVPVVLRNPNVELASILVTDLSDRRVYLPAQDYIVVANGDWIQMFRNPAGNIPEGQTVLVDYVYNRPTNGQIDTFNLDFSVEQAFESGWTPHYAFRFRDQNVDDSTGFPVERDRTDHHRIGLRYDRDRLYFNAEFEIYDDSVDPYDAFHLDGRYTVVRTPEHNLDLAARFSRFFFRGSSRTRGIKTQLAAAPLEKLLDDGLDDRNVSRFDIEADHRWLLADALSAHTRVAYRYQTDSAVGDTNGVDLSSRLRYETGDLSVELTFEYDVLDLPSSDEDGFGVWLTVRREFPMQLTRR